MSKACMESPVLKDSVSYKLKGLLVKHPFIDNGHKDTLKITAGGLEILATYIMYPFFLLMIVKTRASSGSNSSP